MVNRKRNIQLKIWLTEEERQLIERENEACCLLPKSGRICGKWRLTDISFTPTPKDIQDMNKELQRNRPQHKPDCKARQFHKQHIYRRGY